MYSMVEHKHYTGNTGSTHPSYRLGFSMRTVCV